MLLTEYIELLQAFLEKHGNLPVFLDSTLGSGELEPKDVAYVEKDKIFPERIVVSTLPSMTNGV
jgi:hypothetical protein